MFGYVVYVVNKVKCDPHTKVKLVAHNNGFPLVIAAIKTSAGKVKEKGLDYYLSEYARKKLERAIEWIREAKEKYPSVLEHWVFTFFIDGCSRICTHQLVRHRIASYTQESQRYSVAFALSQTPKNYIEMGRAVFGNIDEEKLRLYSFSLWMRDIIRKIDGLLLFDSPPEESVESIRSDLERFVVIPPTLKGRELLDYLLTIANSLYKYVYLVISGVPYEDARFVLPASMRTRILVTANLREWIHIVNLRTSKHAQWEIRCVMSKVREIINSIVPVFE